MKSQNFKPKNFQFTKDNFLPSKFTISMSCIGANVSWDLLFYYILIFVKENQDVSFIDDIFEFFLITLTHIIRYEISENVFNVFVDFMNQILIEKNELTEKVFLLFLGLLAGKKIDHLKPFVIKYHQVIPLFVCSFSKYDNFTEIL